MALFRFPHSWTAIVPADSDLITAVPFLDDRDRALEDYLAGGSWVTATLAGAWANFGGAYGDAQFRKVGDRVELRGLVKSGAVSTTIFTLPAGYWPVAEETFTVESNDNTARVDVQTDGQVVLFSFGAAGSNAFVSLSGVFFSTTV